MQSWQKYQHVTGDLQTNDDSINSQDNGGIDIKGSR